MPSRLLEGTLNDLLLLTQNSKVKISFLSSSPYHSSWDTIKQKGAKAIISVGDDDFYFNRGNIPLQDSTALTIGNKWQKMRFLSQITGGNSTASAKLLLPLLKEDNVIIKRLTLLALAKSKDPAAITAIEKALNDKEPGVQAAAIRAISEVNRPGSINVFLKMLEKKPVHPLIEMARAYLHRMRPFPKKEMIKAALSNPVPQVRSTAIRVLEFFPTDEFLPIFKQGLQDTDGYARYASAMALGKYNKNPQAVDLLISSLKHPDPVVQNRAAVSLGEMLKRKDAAATERVDDILKAVEAVFVLSASDKNRIDFEWGYRSTGEALLMAGDRGVDILNRLMKQKDSSNGLVAEKAWRVLIYKEKSGSNAFNLISEKENDQLFLLKP